MSRFFFVRTVKLGKIFGIRIEIDYSWFLVFALVFYSLGFEFYPQVYGFQLSTSIWLGLFTTLLFFSSVLLHELAHSVVANRNGVVIKKIILFIFGGVASLTQEPKKPGVEFRIAAAGPLTSIILGGLFFGLSLLVFPLSVTIGVALQYLGIINWSLAVFNLVPGYPLDGGRLLRAALWKKFGLERATTIAARFGVGVGYLIVLYGIAQLILFGNLLGLVWFGFIGFFLISAARESVLQVLLMAALNKVRVRDLLSPNPVVVDATSSVRKLVEDIMLGLKQQGSLVRAGNQIVGTVDVERVRRLPVKDLGRVPVSRVMYHLKAGELLKTSLSAARALQIMATDGSERLPVFENGRLVGAVTRDDIRVYLAVKTDLLNRDHRGSHKI